MPILCLPCPQRHKSGWSVSHLLCSLGPSPTARRDQCQWRGTPVLVGEHSLAVLALVGLPIAATAAETLRLEAVAQVLVECGPSRAARVLLVASKVQLALEELVTLVTAKCGLLCKTEIGQVGRAAGTCPGRGTSASR